MGGGLSLQQGALVSKAELCGHTDAVLGVACFTLPDGSPRAISASSDKTLRVWDPLAGTSLVTLEGHTSTVWGVACFTLPDGSPRAISACSDRTLRVWDCPDGLVEAVRASMRAREEELNNECTFFFLDAAYVRALDGPLPVFQEVQRLGKLTRVTIKLREVVRAAYRKHTLVVSHRWEEPTLPDAKGEQLRVLKAHLDAHSEIERVWIDWSCMPQGERTPVEATDFKRMLPRINMLYLGCSVLLIVDKTYDSRFWTSFEAWLSMRLCTPAGLAPTGAAAPRFTIECIHLAKQKFQGAQLLEMWMEASAEEAHETLSSPDVTVTNQSDKDMQLPKLKQLDELVRETFAQMSREANAKRAEAARLEEEAQALVEKAKGLREEADEMEASMRCSA